MTLLTNSILVPLDSSSWAIANTKVSNEHILNLIAMPDLFIREIRAPLSSVTSETLKLFMQVHGRNIEKLNLQNTPITGEDFVRLAKEAPNLRTLSFQYLHNICDKDLLNVIETCKDLQTLIISQNRQITPKIFPQILDLDRHFKELSLNLLGRAAASDKESEISEAPPKAQIETLKLSGLPFGNRDVINAAAIQTLKSLSLTLTNAEPNAVVELYCSLNNSKKLTIKIQDISEKKLSKFESTFMDHNIQFTRTKTAIELST